MPTCRTSFDTFSKMRSSSKATYVADHVQDQIIENRIDVRDQEVLSMGVHGDSNC